MTDGLQYYWDYFPSTVLFSDQYVWRREKAPQQCLLKEAARFYATYWEPLLETAPEGGAQGSDTSTWDWEICCHSDDSDADTDDDNCWSPAFIWDSFLDYAESVETYPYKTADAVTSKHHVGQDLAEQTCETTDNEDEDDDDDSGFGVRLCMTF